MNTFQFMLMIYALLHKIQKELISILKSKHQLKVKGDGPLTYDLGADFTMILMEQWCVNLRNILRN